MKLLSGRHLHRYSSTGPPVPRPAGLRIMLPLLAELATTSLLLPGAPQHLLPPNLQMRDHWSPMWHQQDRSHLAAGDVNAFFYFRGVWHLMTQWEMQWEMPIAAIVGISLSY